MNNAWIVSFAASIDETIFHNFQNNIVDCCITRCAYQQSWFALYRISKLDSLTSGCHGSHSSYFFIILVELPNVQTFEYRHKSGRFPGGPLQSVKPPSPYSSAAADIAANYEGLNLRST
jgi:hypothetical protein